MLNKNKYEYKRNFIFLLSVLKLSLTAFGGPQIHLTLFYKQLVAKKKFLFEDELKEINSFCSMMPGPTSTQTICAVAYKLGGAKLAYLTLFIWALPGACLMTFSAIFINHYALSHPKLDFLKFLLPMASAFVIFAGYKYTTLFITKKYHWYILIFCAVASALFSSPYLIPLLLICGGAITSYINTRGQINKPEPIKNINYSNLLLMLSVLVTAALLGAVTKNKSVLMFENIYRYGSIIFGGGQVLIPLMFNQFVSIKQYVSGTDFLTGVGLIQAMPGPVFNFAAFIGASAAKDAGYSIQFIAGIFSSVAIFLPGLFILFFIYPIWNQYKSYPPVKNAVEGINAASAGLVISSAYLLFLQIDITRHNMLVLLITLFLLLNSKIPGPVIVAACIIAGFIF